MNTNKLSFRKDFFPILFIFVVAGLIRAWPEIKVGAWPIGYDTFNTYAPDILKFDGNFLRWIFSANLLYFLIWPFYKLFAIDPYLLIKIFGPILYGLFGGGFYLFLRKYMKWGALMSFFASVLLILQLGSLRMSWDLFRNILGIIFLFPALYLLENSEEFKHPVLLMIFSILIILSNQLVASLWFVILLVWLLKQLKAKKYQSFLEALIACLPSIVVFILILKSPGLNNFGGHVFYKGESERIFNYFEVYKKDISYEELTNTIVGLFWFCYGYILPLVLIGFYLLRKNLLLTTMTLWLLLGTFSAVIFGGYGLFVWSRWLFMLVIPFTIYTTYALFRIGHFIATRKIFNNMFFAYLFSFLGGIVCFGYLVFFAWRNFPFVATENSLAKAPFLDAKFNSYIPPTMMNNAVGYENLDHILESIDYLNKKTPSNAVILVDNRYRGLVLTKLDYSERYIYTYAWSAKPNQKIIQEIRDKNLGPIYTIWNYRDGVSGFDRVFKSGEISVYKDQYSDE